jgi:hypothetical protein
MILAGFVGELGRRPHGGGGRRGGGFHRVRPGSYYSYAYPTAETYVAPVVLAPSPCTQWPNPVPPCAGTLVWTDSKTVCCR